MFYYSSACTVIQQFTTHLNRAAAELRPIPHLRSEDTTVERSASSVSKSGTWLRRLGVAGFVFFLVKGLAWLVVGAVVVKGVSA